MSFPNFPILRKLVPEDRDAYLELYGRIEPYSDFSFNNVLVWLDINDDLEIAQLRDCFVLRFSNPFEDGKTSYTLLGNSGCLDATEEVFDHLQLLGEEPRLVMVPECAVSDMLTTGDTLPRNLVVSASSAHRDYLFDINEVLELKGKKYAELRHSLNVFNRQYGDQISVQVLNIRESATQRLLSKALESWLAEARFTKNDPRAEEHKALKRYMKYSQWCPAKCLGFFLDDKLFGFSISHLPPQKGWAIGNHIKCNPDIKYAFDFICYTTMYVLHQEGIDMINGEQDLGVQGLRTHKQQLGPAGFLYRYDISRM